MCKLPQLLYSRIRVTAGVPRQSFLHHGWVLHSLLRAASTSTSSGHFTLLSVADFGPGGNDPDINHHVLVVQHRHKIGDDGHQLYVLVLAWLSRVTSARHLVRVLRIA